MGKMTHKGLVDIFTKMMVNTKLKCWWKKGPDAVRIRMTDGQDYVFTYLSSTEWKIETIKMHESSVDGI